jgi:hypothetical protein
MKLLRVPRLIICRNNWAKTTLRHHIHTTYQVQRQLTGLPILRRSQYKHAGRLFSNMQTRCRYIMTKIYYSEIKEAIVSLKITSDIWEDVKDVRLDSIFYFQEDVQLVCKCSKP